jgi:trk system potassium uptake protein TrkA
VRLIAHDEADAEYLSRNLGGEEVVRGSGTDLEVLGQEGIHRADWFISLSPQDEMNLLACQLAKSAGAQRTIALVNQPDFAALSDRLGIDHSVSPRRLVARRIAQFVRADSEGSITQIHHGAAEVLDKHIPEGSRHTGRTLQEVGLPLGTVVGGIIRGDEVIVPRGDTRLEVGDHLIVFALREVLRDVQEFFSGGEEPVPEGTA